MHSPVRVCDEIGDLLVALSKCPNAPILIVVEIHGAIHVLIPAAISVPEVVQVHLDPRLELADRLDLVRVVHPVLEMMTAAEIRAVILVAAIVIVPLVEILAIDLAEIVALVANSVIDLLAIVDRAVNMAAVRFVAMTAVVILAVIRAVILAVAIVIVHPAEILMIVTALHVVTCQDLTHVVAIVIVLLVAMAQALAAHLVRVVMTAVMPKTETVVAVDRVAKTSLHADQRMKLSVVVQPCVHAVAAKYAKTVSRHRCHAKPRPGLMKVELKTMSAMPPKVRFVEA